MKTDMTPKIEEGAIGQSSVTLADALDEVLDKGAFLTGEATLNVADIDLIFLGIKLLVAPTRKMKGRGNDIKNQKVDRAEIKQLEKKLREVELSLPEVINQSANNPEQGIAKLVLTLVVLIKSLLENEAVRKIDSGQLNRKQIEKLGLSFKLLDRKIEELKAVFGVKGDLNLDLGPLGKLM